MHPPYTLLELSLDHLVKQSSGLFYNFGHVMYDRVVRIKFLHSRIAKANTHGDKVVALAFLNNTLEVIHRILATIAVVTARLTVANDNEQDVVAVL